MTACFSRGELQIVKVGVQPGVLRAVLPSRVPAPPGGCVLGQGLCRLPGSALSLPGELPTVLWGEAVGGRGDSQQEAKKVLNGSGLLTAPDHPTTLAESPFEEGHQGSIFLKGKQFVH